MLLNNKCKKGDAIYIIVIITFIALATFVGLYTILSSYNSKIKYSVDNNLNYYELRDSAEMLVEMCLKDKELYLDSVKTNLDDIKVTTGEIEYKETQFQTINYKITSDLIAVNKVSGKYENQYNVIIETMSNVGSFENVIIKIQMNVTSDSSSDKFYGTELKEISFE